MRFFFAFILILTSIIWAFAQDTPFSNELKGFEFFGKGKLKTVVFGVTKKKDIEKLFGSSCENDCEYDDRFKIKFNFIDQGDCMTTKKVRDRAVCPLDQFMGTIEKISLTPKADIHFDRVSTEHFPIHTGGSVYSLTSRRQVSYESFGDESGLKYSIRRETSVSITPGPAFMTGPLYSIDYGLSDELIERIFMAPFRRAN